MANLAMNPWQLEKMIYRVMVIDIINITQMVEAGCWMKAFEDDLYTDGKNDNQYQASGKKPTNE